MAGKSAIWTTLAVTWTLANWFAKSAWCLPDAEARQRNRTRVRRGGQVPQETVVVDLWRECDRVFAAGDEKSAD